MEQPLEPLALPMDFLIPLAADSACEGFAAWLHRAAQGPEMAANGCRKAGEIQHKTSCIP
jgi:hypothetical protein